MEYVKICGLRDPQHVKLCLEYGADAVGFIYNVPSSPRNLEKTELMNLLREFPKGILQVIILKSDSLSDCINIMNEIKADLYQIHCSFNIRQFDRLPITMRKRIVVGIKVNKDNKEEVIRDINFNFDQFFAFLLDNSEGHSSQMDYDLVLEILQRTYGSKIILAGGINIDSLEYIMRSFRPFGIDVSSALESEKGVKDPIRIIKFLYKIKELKEILKK